MIQSRFLDIYSGPEFHFWKWIPLLGDSYERGFFNSKGGGGHFLDIFHTYSVCSAYAVHVRYVRGAEAALTVVSHRSLQLIHGCLLQTQQLSIILISNPNIVT